MTLAATGHRPPALLGYSDESFTRYVAAAEHVLLDTMPETVVSGMAQGWDMAIATACVNLGFPFLAYVAFEGVDRKWYPRDRRKFAKLCDAAAEVVVVTKGTYSPWKLQARNEAMVEKCDRLAAMWNGEQRGGTWNCLKYATERGKPWTNYWDYLMT